MSVLCDENSRTLSTESLSFTCSSCNACQHCQAWSDMWDI